MRLYSRVGKLILSGLGAWVLLIAPAAASDVTVTIKGSDAIFLAGRTDLVIPPASSPWPGGLIRHGFPTPEEIQETLPPFIPVSGGDVIRATDPAVGAVSFFNGFAFSPDFGGIVFCPRGNGLSGSNLSSFGGISGYIGPQGALTGVFLDDSIPVAGPPPTLNFSPAGLGIDFPTLSPALGQVFYIGDGITSGDVFQEFIAPAGATRLFLGIPDGFGFTGAPGAYDDNDGSYRISIGATKRTCDCDDPVIMNPMPFPTLIAGNGWSMTVDISERDGLVLGDVFLGQRYMARKISVPYLMLETTLFPKQRLELTPNGIGPGASRLIDFQITRPSGFFTFTPLVIEATYLICNISPQGKSCLRVTQRYEFFPAINEDVQPELSCESSQTIPGPLGGILRLLPGLTCARLNPIIRYEFCAQEGENLTSVNIPERLHFQVERATQATHLLVRDHDSLGLTKPFTVLGGNPLASERIETPIDRGEKVQFPEKADNFHQSFELAPGDGLQEPLPPPGCPECVHIHWRWGEFQAFPLCLLPGRPVIPIRSNQSVQFAIVRAEPAEEHPFNFEDFVNSESVVNTDNVFWYSGTGIQPADAFFIHGLFFSPNFSRQRGNVAVQFSDDADPGPTTFTAIDPASAGPLPPGFSAFENMAVDITTEGTTGSGPIQVAFGVPALDDPEVFSRLRVFHQEGGLLVDRTILEPDTPASSFEVRTLYARVDSLSPFVVALFSEQTVNRPPVARCRNLEVPAGSSCSAELSPGDVDAGSLDPDGDSLSLTLSPRGPFELGSHNLTLTAADPSGASSSCGAVVAVLDQTPPILAGSLRSDGQAVRVDIEVADRCDASPAVLAVMSAPDASGFRVVFKSEQRTERIDIRVDERKVVLRGPNQARLRAKLAEMIELHGARVSDRQMLKLRPTRKNRFRFDFVNGELVRMKAPELVLQVVATDDSGNRATASARPRIPRERRDDDDDDDDDADE